jgi:hypothetical protein
VSGAVAGVLAEQAVKGIDQVDRGDLLGLGRACQGGHNGEAEDGNRYA